jgi:23S rRNA (cytidine1920-2'-O)/16S rRNA (cytidine1409-2'-O)-methyltransferase
MQKTRVDLLLVSSGLVESRAKAQALIMAGQIRVDGELVVKPSDKVSTSAEVLIDEGNAFVSRGGNKLLAALEAFAVNVSGKVCADVGASTGGFTDCLLQHGASKVYAIDVGYGILHWKLRQDVRVIVMERTNARFLEVLPEPVELVSVDASFISLSYLLPVIKNWFSGRDGSMIALIKPQFEAGREQARQHAGVIKDEAVHVEVLHRVLSQAEEIGYSVRGLIASPIKGPKGNIEFLVDLAAIPPGESLDHTALIASALAGAPG